MKLDPGAAAALRAMILRDLQIVDLIHSRLQGFHRDDGHPYCAAAGYNLHNLYNALENSFEQISRSFENHVVDGTKWHQELLGKMFLDMEGLRPRVFDETHRKFLNDLRGFRHVFRHGYGMELDPAKLETLIADWNAQHHGIIRSLEHFAASLPVRPPA